MPVPPSCRLKAALVSRVSRTTNSWFEKDDKYNTYSAYVLRGMYKRHSVAFTHHAIETTAPGSGTKLQSG